MFVANVCSGVSGTLSTCAIAFSSFVAPVEVYLSVVLVLELPALCVGTTSFFGGYHRHVNSPTPF